MSLKIYINSEIQSFKKVGSGDILAGLQKSKTFKLLQIYDAYSDVSNAITKFEVVELNQIGNEIGRQTLPNSIIKYNNGQYVIDFTQDLGFMLEPGIYYFEFLNGKDIFKSDIFIAKKIDIEITADMTIITADNDIVRVNDENIII